jgi:hypothetical protein
VRSNGGAFIVAQGNEIAQVTTQCAGQQALLAHPVVVEHFRQVLVAAVAGKGHHAFRRGLRTAAQRCRQQRAAEEPARIPSTCRSSRAVVKASQSLMRNALRTLLMCANGG